MDINEVLAAQRAAFTAALPEPLSVHRDRLKHAAAMIRDNADRFCDAVSEDFGHRSREQSMLTDIAGSIAPITHALANLERWAKPERRAVRSRVGRFQDVQPYARGVQAVAPGRREARRVEAAIRRGDAEIGTAADRPLA
ncbi:hypothetical protein [uncultured Sphingomonas sp.]|uniref:hypothetical protein n=1 Tax=uncultured Sphingomonas sp. TaxID=158754 RepID=UPI0035CAE3A9